MTVGEQIGYDRTGNKDDQAEWRLLWKLGRIINHAEFAHSRGLTKEAKRPGAAGSA